MKKIIVLLLIGVTCLTLVACGKKPQKDSTANTAEASANAANSDAEKAILGTWETAGGKTTLTFNSDKTLTLKDGEAENYVWKYDAEFGCYLFTSPLGDEVWSLFLTNENGNDYLSTLGAKFHRQGEAPPVADNVNTDYVGEWKARIEHANFGEPVYRNDAIILNADASASFIKDVDSLVYDSPKEETGTWEYVAEKNRIIVTLDFGNMVLDIKEKDSKTVLAYFSDGYYRAEEFVEE